MNPILSLTKEDWVILKNLWAKESYDFQYKEESAMDGFRYIIRNYSVMTLSDYKKSYFRKVLLTIFSIPYKKIPTQLNKPGPIVDNVRNLLIRFRLQIGK